MGDSQISACRAPAALGGLVLLTLLAAGCDAAAVGGSSAPPPPAGGEPAVAAPRAAESATVWDDVDRLVEDGRLRAALDRVEALGEAARRRGDAAAWTTALVRATQLRLALHGYETALVELRAAPWPEAALERAVLDLYAAHALVAYLRAYGWEIAQRERLAGDPGPDLRRWSRDQIVAEAHRTFAGLWARREAWGRHRVGELADYLEPNNYPDGIRDTLRDAVSYLWVELLADTGLWSPAEEHAVARLDLEALLAGEAEAAERRALDPQAHPLERMAAVLADLESWHAAAGRPEAAFEARLERLRRLRDRFSRDEERRALTADLRSRLDRLGSTRPWWAMGMAELAELVAAADAADALVAARRIALDGADAHPESIGGRRCRALAAEIEEPDYQLEAMAADGLGRRSLRVRHKNLPALHFRAWRLELERTVASSEDWYLLPRRREIERLLAERPADREWTLELPETVDYRHHDTYATPPFERSGVWVVVGSARADFAPEENRLAAVSVVIGDLVLLGRELDDSVEITARSGATGEPVAGAWIRLYHHDWQGRPRLVATRATRADGTVRLVRRGRRNGAFFFLGRHGDDAALGPRSLDLWRREARPRERSLLIYTDRSAYRPGQELLWKVVAYADSDRAGRFATLAGAAVEVVLHDANGEEVARAEVETNEHGSASGSFRLPRGRLLGRWWLRAEPGATAAVQVEEYKRPTFEVEIGEPAEALRLNRPAALGGEARYYFGLPVAEGRVGWRVTREPVYPYWWGWRDPGSRGGAEVVAAGQGVLAADGSFEMAFTPVADERDAGSGISYRYRLAAEVTDSGGETRSAERVFRLGFTAVEAEIDPGAGFLDAAVPATVTVLRRDLDGTPRAGAASWRLVAVDQPDAALLPAERPRPVDPERADWFRTPGDRLRPRWDTDESPEAVLASWADGPELVRGELTHGDDGTGELRLPPLAPGVYRLRYTTADPFGGVYELAQELVVAARGATPLALPALLRVERQSVPVGGTMRVLVHSGLADQDLVLEILRDGEPIETRRFDSAAGLQIVERPVGDEDRGGLGVRLTALRDHQILRLAERVLVPWDDRELQLSFATFRDRLRPGQRESWRVTVRGADEAALAAGSAELLAYMHDRSLDLFARHEPPDPLRSYPLAYPPQPVESPLGPAGEVWWRGRLPAAPRAPELAGDRLLFLSGYGVGGLGRERHMVARMQVPAAPRVGGEAPAGAAVVEESASYAEPAAADRKVPIPDPTPGAPEPGPPVELRADFAETAFWEPHLVVGEDGSVAFEFTVPESVTEWSVWVHALTRDLRAGRLERRARTVKELLVRPYLPRFLREGDRAVLAVVVQNAGERPLAGSLDLDLRDPATGESLLERFAVAPEAAAGVAFSVEPGAAEELSFTIAAPLRLGEVAVRVTARAGDLSDGELRPLPVLPGRLHLAQSRFAAIQGPARRELVFADLAAAAADPSLVHDRMVVTLDGQLFHSVLRAVPYLVDYPYECTEQIANRFISTAILSSVFDRYPAVAALARELAARDSRLERWDDEDPNRAAMLEETPWLAAARGGREAGEGLAKVLDPKIAGARREASLAQLEKAQTSLGGFPWWPGGPPSPYMTLYLLHSFAKAAEFGVEVPRPLVERAWGYLHRHYVDEIVAKGLDDGCCRELVTFLNYVLSSYPDPGWTGGVFSAADRERMLELSFRHWRETPPLLKAYLSLTLWRAGRRDDARLVFDSILDSARTDPDLGTYWAPEERSWLWYNDTIEGHAFALRALTELAPDDPRRHGLVQWLFLNKKLNHWKSTRATAEVLYALVHYLAREELLGEPQVATVGVGDEARRFRFWPDRVAPTVEPVGAGGAPPATDELRAVPPADPEAGRGNQWLIPGAELGAHSASVSVETPSRGLLFASATWHFSTTRLPEEARGDLFQVTRRFYRRVLEEGEWTLVPLEPGASLGVGDQLEVQLTVTARHAAEYVHLRDPRAAGLEPEALRSGYRWDLGLGYYEETRDSGANFFFEWLPAGEYTLRHRLRAATAGRFRVGPATLQSMYAPEFAAYSSGVELAVE